jgi:hypothetical protein
VIKKSNHCAIAKPSLNLPFFQENADGAKGANAEGTQSSSE